MFRYYQTSDKSEWILIKDSPDVEEKAKSQGAKKLTILALSEPIDESTDKAKVAYKGPMYFDIDASDIGEAIDSTRRLVTRLLEYGVHEDEIAVYASGGKGFHVIIHEKVFSKGRQQTGLPGTYMELALMFYVDHMDMGVYSASRGRCWRLANVQRDSGTYRVRIRHDVLFQMTKEQYQEIVSRPSAEVFPPQGKHFSVKLESLFEIAKSKAKAKVSRIAAVPDEKLGVFSDHIPACMDEIAAGHIEKGHNFNQVAFQVAVFLARSGVKDPARSAFVEKVSSTLTSGSYPNARSREEHIRGLEKYMAIRKEVKFSCGAVRSILRSNPCDGCALKVSSDATEEVETLGIERRADGYWALGAEKDRKLTNFLLDPIAVYLEEPQGGVGVVRRVGTKMDIIRHGQSIGTFFLEESGWETKSRFISQIGGIDNCIFTGSDYDIQILKCVVMQEDNDVGEITQVYSAGIHHHKVGRKFIRVYVEPGVSINQMRIRDTHFLSGRVPTPPSVMNVDPLKPGAQEDDKVIAALLRINEPFRLAQIVGWFVACHFKTHLMERYSQFPILSIWGNASSGKSRTTTLMACLNGCDYIVEGAALNMSSVTPWAMLSYCSSTTTVPRLLEEYNKSKLSNQSYAFCGEVMKASWNGDAIARGTIGRSRASGRGRTGAEVVEIPVTGPLVVISEQAPTMPALVQRSVTVMMDEKTRNPKAYLYASLNRESLVKLARALVIKSLQTDPEEVSEIVESMDAKLPAGVTDRPRYSYQVVGMGLEMLRRTLDEYEMRSAGEVRKLQTALIDGLKDKAKEIEQAKKWSEVDGMLEALGVLVAMAESGADDTLRDGVHYVLTEDYLYIDMTLTHTVLRKFFRSMGSRIVIESLAQFNTLIKMESYYEGEGPVDAVGAITARPMVKLSLAKMAEKGHVRSSFSIGG